jgi:hypothetical protein
MATPAPITAAMRVRIETVGTPPPEPWVAVELGVTATVLAGVGGIGVGVLTAER